MACKFKDLLSHVIGSRVEVSSVTLNILNSASFEGLVVYDQYNKKMLDIGKADVSFECLPLLDGTLRLSSVKLRDGELCLYKKNKDSKLNCQFVIDSLSSKDSGHGLEVQLGSVVAKNLKIHYDILSEPESYDFIDGNHITVADLNCSLFLKNIKQDNLSLRIRNLDFCMGTAFSVKRFCASVCSVNNGKELSVSLKRGKFVCKKFYSTLHESHLLVNKDALSKSFVSSIIALGVNVDVGLANTPEYNISAGVANSRSTTSYPLEFTLALRQSSMLLGNARVLASSWSFDRLCGEYSVDLNRRSIAPILKTFNLKIPNFANIDKLETLKQTASFRSEGNDCVWNGQTKSNIGNLSHSIRKEGGRVLYDFCLKRFILPEIYGLRNLKVSSATINGDVSSGQIGNIPLSALLKMTMPKDVLLSSKISVDSLSSSELNVNHVSLSVELNKRLADVVADVMDPSLKLHSVVRCDISRFSDVLQNGITNSTKKSEVLSVPSPCIYVKASIDHLNAGLLKRFVGKTHVESFGAKDIEISFSDNRDYTISVVDYSCRYKNGQSKSFGNMSLTCNSSSNLLKYDMRGDGFAGHLLTNLDFKCIAKLYCKQLATHFPSLVNREGVLENSCFNNGFANLKLKFQSGSLASELIKDYVETESPVYIDASVSADNKYSFLTAFADRIRYNGNSYDDVSLYYNNKPDSLNGVVMFTKLTGDDSVRVESTFAGTRNILSNEIKWKTGNVDGTRGSVVTKTLFSRDDKDRVCCDVKVLPSRFFVKDTVWNVSPANILYCGNQLTIDEFRVSHQNQYLNFNAAVSDTTQDVLLELNDVEVAYILGLVNFDPVEFSGRAFGNIRNLGRDKLLGVNLSVKNFCFNTGPMGTLDLKGLVDVERKNVNFKASTHLSSDDSTLISGVVDIGNNNLDMSIKSEKTNLQFLNKFVGGFVADLEGTVSGDFRLFGDLKYLNMEGRHRVNYMKFRPKMLGVLYSFENDSLHIRPDTIDFDGMTLHDSYGNTAKVTGSLNHHSLFRFDYKLNFDLDGLQLIDWKRLPSRSFAGRIFTDGNIGINGDFKKVNIGGELSTSGKTGTSALYYNSESASSDEEENSYIRFVESHNNVTKREEEEKRTYSLKDNGTDIYINFKFNVNPNATLNIITDPTTSDLMALDGSGALSMNYYNKGRFLLNGLYNISGGSYKLTIKDIIRKNFIIQPGGYLRFNGNLSDGDINIKGVHKINSVSLSDLNVGASYSNSTIGADCILNFTGKMSEPKVSFGLDFPNANADENKIIKNLLLTEEDRNMQAVYLLSIGRFYTYNYDSFNSSGQSQSSVAMSSFLAGTLSGQINNLLQDAFHIDNWNFDTNIATGRLGWDDMEVQGSLSGKMFNNRLLFNGNIGYRDQITTYSNNFVGNFNLRWFLNKSGSISLKAYSETNDRYFTKSTLTTQGGGIMFRKDFDKLRFFFKSNK